MQPVTSCCAHEVLTMRCRIFVLAVVAIVFSVGPAPMRAAQLGSRSSEEWLKTLDSPTRIEGLKVDETIAKLGLKAGMIVADVGAGSGIFEGPLAKAVGPAGTVYAVDVDQGLLDAINKKAATAGVTNVKTVLGKFTDPALPASDVDVAFINDVLHHIEDRATYLKNLARYIKPSGRIALIDFNPDGGGHRNQPELQVSKDKAASLMADAGFKAVEEISLFTDKYFVVYARR
jgi:ubiquinone/menaquinone biosynthesis C-methylase UbiE